MFSLFKNRLPEYQEELKKSMALLSQAGGSRYMADDWQQLLLAPQGVKLAKACLSRNIPAREAIVIFRFTNFGRLPDYEEHLLNPSVAYAACVLDTRAALNMCAECGD
jgi:hypothetical protein